MPLPVIDSANFLGFINISQNKYDTADLDNFSERAVANYVRQYLGGKAYIELRDNTPNLDRWADVLSGIDYTNDNDKLVAGRGFQEVLEKLTYFDYVQEQPVRNTATGNVGNNNENAIALSSSANGQDAWRRYLDACNIFNEELLEQMRVNRNQASEVTGQSELAGVYTLSVASTKYLATGDEVTIGGAKYTASNIVANTSFDISADAGLTFTGLTAKWEPYDEVPFCRIPEGFV